MRRIQILVVCFVIIVLLVSGCSTGNKSWSSETTSELPTEEYTYINRIGQTCSYSVSGNNITIYEKMPNELIQEWSDNVAFAEKSYKQENVYILTEGYIESINKNEFDNDAYYIKLIEDKNKWNVLGTDSVEVYFHNEREYESLLNTKKGEYITLLCQVEDTTMFLEYPRLEATLVLNPNSDMIGLPEYIGLTTEDIIAQYGDDFEVESIDGYYYIYYEKSCPYYFYYDSKGNEDISIPEPDDLINAVATATTEISVVNGITTGNNLKDIEEILKIQLDPVIENEGDLAFDYITINGLEFVLAFDPDSQNLVYAFCSANDMGNISSTNESQEAELGQETSLLKPSDRQQEKLDTLEETQREKMFMLCIAQDDLESYVWGGKSAFPEIWKLLDINNNFDGQLMMLELESDLDVYMTYGTSEFELVWAYAETAYSQYQSGELEKNMDAEQYKEFLNKMNQIYSRLGILYSSREVANSFTN